MNEGPTGNESIQPAPGPSTLPPSKPREALPNVSLVLIVFGVALVSLAMSNKVPRIVPGRTPMPRAGGGVVTAQRASTTPRLRLVDARLTEQGRAVFTTIGGSALIIAFFLALSGL